MSWGSKAAWPTLKMQSIRIKFRNALKGMIIGQFTVAEYEHYIQNSSSINKRMMQMVMTRIQDQLQLLEAVPQKRLSFW